MKCFWQPYIPPPSVCALLARGTEERENATFPTGLTPSLYIAPDTQVNNTE